MKQSNGHDREVQAEVERLRGASDDRLRAWDEKLGARRTAWYRRYARTPGKGDPLERAYRILLQKLGIGEDQAPVVHRDETSIVFHSRNFCPTLEACRILGLDTRRVCRLSSEKSTDALVKLVSPNLKFSRNYQRIRPCADFCEERISYEGGNP